MKSQYTRHALASKAIATQKVTTKLSMGHTTPLLNREIRRIFNAMSKKAKSTTRGTA